MTQRCLTSYGAVRFAPPSTFSCRMASRFVSARQDQWVQIGAERFQFFGQLHDRIPGSPDADSGEFIL